MYRIIASSLLVAVVLAVWYLTQGQSQAPEVHHDEGININVGG